MKSCTENSLGVPMASYFDSLCSAFSTCLDFFFFLEPDTYTIFQDDLGQNSKCAKDL